MGIFKIDADNFGWIGGAADDPQDRCLHGHVGMIYDRENEKQVNTYKVMREDLYNIKFEILNEE